MSLPETIVAAATPSGRGGVGIVRLSGARTPDLARIILGRLPPPRVATAATFRGAEGEIDYGLALFFEAPHSFTGEHVLELHGHGGLIVMDALIKRAVQLGARIARPGEFTERAFLNDKLDLAQAEAIADLIDSGSHEAAQAALRSLQGEFSAMVQGLIDAVIELRTHVEAAIDFPDDEIDFLADDQIERRLESVLGHFDAITAIARQGRLLRDGMTVVIAGAPNAGKSSLMNRLAGYDVAIINEVAGTTRDVLRERINLDGMPLHVLDTAGLHALGDAVEAEGIRRARSEMTRADLILFVIDAASDPQAASFQAERDRLPGSVPITLIFNKADLVGHQPEWQSAESPGRLWLSARTAAGLDLLREHLKAHMGFSISGAGNISARRRHLEALRRARGYVESGRERLRTNRAGELLAEELRHAHAALGEITGEFTSEDLLASIFASFCIGK
jgi:tRNA modification GTPase